MIQTRVCFTSGTGVSIDCQIQLEQVPPVWSIERWRKIRRISPQSVVDDFQTGARELIEDPHRRLSTAAPCSTLRL
jgi:hypothetical protein